MVPAIARTVLLLTRIVDELVNPLRVAPPLKPVSTKVPPPVSDPPLTVTLPCRFTTPPVLATTLPAPVLVRLRPLTPVRTRVPPELASSVPVLVVPPLV